MAIEKMNKNLIEKINILGPWVHGFFDLGDGIIIKDSDELQRKRLLVVSGYLKDIIRSYYHEEKIPELVVGDIGCNTGYFLFELYKEFKCKKLYGFEPKTSNLKKANFIRDYFEISKDPKYGELSNRIVEEMRGGARVEVRSEKRHPGDFALWKRAESDHLMRWRDPYSGWGYPGWHTECVVMSTRYLGEEFDIHGGGMDLKFPHHECEIAQARGLAKPFARNWMHSNMLTIEGQKMSKSSGNFVTLLELFERYDPLMVRYFMAASHYRSVVDFSETALEAAGSSLKRLHQTVRNLRKCKTAGVKVSGKYFAEFRRRFCEAMDDDFSTPQAFAVLFDLSREANNLLAEKKPDPEAVADAEHLFSTLGGDVLGIIPQTLNDVQTDLRLNDVMDILLELRANFRKNKDFESADLIRERLENMGIVFKDSVEGTTWEMTDKK